jgi:hypothetical protein
MFTSSCKTLKDSGYGYELALPNQVKIGDNLYCDKTEVSNIAWREYEMWNKITFGNKSNEHLNSLPDTLVWLAIDSSLAELGYQYYRSPTYKQHPVVGISQNQAKEYAIWRSNRVMEMMLVTEFNYSPQSNRHPDSLFTIEKFIANELKVYPYKTSIKYYPEFSLPNDNERQTIVDFCANNFSLVEGHDLVHINGLTENNIQKYGMVTRGLPEKRTEKGIFDVEGNVAEWSDLDQTSYGSSWIDSTTSIKLKSKVKNKYPNAWTGLRNICSWKRIR